MNLKKTVCILTAGVGSRIGSYSTYLNKSLLPIKKKAAISHIIDQFSNNTEFVIAIGHFGKQVKNFLKLTYPEKKFKFVNVKKYKGKNTGPGLSLYNCKKLLQKPFYFVSCDTIWTKKINHLEKNWMGTNYNSIKKNSSFCNLVSKSKKIIELIDKKQVSSACNQFIGLAYIKDYKIFWEGIDKKKIIKGEIQVSNGFNNLIRLKDVYINKFDWHDIGTIENYKKTIKFFEKYNFSKTNEFIYINKSRVVKYFRDKKKCSRITKLSKINKNFYPKIDKFSENFISYKFINGHTLYEKNSPKITRSLLNYLEKSFWKINKKQIKNVCKKFYKDKTIQRLHLYKQKYNFRADKTNYINGEKTERIEKLLNQVKWKDLYDGIPCRIHGDLQFDNILITNDKQFKLIDYRDNFGGEIEYGDKYYDLAKLYGGMILNYSLIKQNKFKYLKRAQKIDYSLPRAKTKEIKVFFEFLKEKELSISKVKLLTSIIFLNMAPLHEFPFDQLLFAHGKLKLQESLNEKFSK